MTEQEMLDKIKELEERNQFLENIVSRGNAGYYGAYNTIRGMIINKVKNEVIVPEEQKWRERNYIGQKERQIMRDLLWNIRVRRVTELRTEHIKQAEEFVNDYKFEEVN